MDIVERLKADELPNDRQLQREARATLRGLLNEAATEIERLREALEYFTCDCEGDDCQEPYHDCGRVARDALKLIDGAGIPWVPKKQDEPETLKEKE